MTIRRLIPLALALVVSSLVTLPAVAHHSLAMFDLTKQVSLKGTVTEVQWTNPHALIYVEVPAGDPLAGVWELVLNSPNNLRRTGGWTSKTVKAGDKVTAVAYPLRNTNDKKGGLFNAITFADGKVIAVQKLPGAV
jgi:hypothetical protein